MVRTIGPQGGAAVPAASVNLSAGRRDACATVIAPPEEVRERFKRVKPLGEIKAKERGWTLDVLNIVRRLVEEKRASALECSGTTPLSLWIICLKQPRPCAQERGGICRS